MVVVAGAVVLVVLLLVRLQLRATTDGRFIITVIHDTDYDVDEFAMRCCCCLPLFLRFSNFITPSLFQEREAGEKFLPKPLNKQTSSSPVIVDDTLTMVTDPVRDR